MGYPSVIGRLHTRYAPVRNSSAPEGLLPFYLHVLSLPLAFILSQDQTLHCKESYRPSGVNQGKLLKESS